ncbi:efflux RND transporter periplasmic adaptor subunit [Ruminococcus callidus]|uniref:efflux RND transporter periplasmic adaptor subunit n=1 Tax=Ruminococcus callidus TaxID=40519 RepID=UPI00266EC35B|nr:HlyD family efflux transporter periplasmic adaptor subunit [uncultured Ruminococcus sp.]
MGKSKKIIIGTVAGVTAAAVCVSGVLVWRHYSRGSDVDGVAYVMPIKDVNSAATTISDLQFSGVVEPQETKEVKLDTSKKVSSIVVQEGDHVNAGDPLFTYDVESMQLELQQGNVEIERMQNEIESNKQQISQLETEKKSASADDKLTYTTQIQSLQTDIAKSEYDIKTKKIELEKLQNTINNATVTAEIAGTVQSLKTTEQLQSDGTDVLMKIMSDGEFRVKCTISEQNVQSIYKDEAMVLHSRVDDSSWTGTISEISTEADNSQNNNMYYGGSDEMTTASKYPFYVTLDSSDGLMLGQHLLVSADTGADESIEKTGIWLYSDYVQTDENGKTYVWAADKKDRLEKREVEVGQTDDTMGDCEIKSGLSEDDMIAFPSDSYQEGMKTTTNPDEATPEDDGTDDTVDDNSNEDISYGENGNPVDEGVIGGADNEAGMAGDGADGDTADSVISGAGEDAGDGVDEMPADEAGADTAEGGASDGT